MIRGFWPLLKKYRSSALIDTDFILAFFAAATTAVFFPVAEADRLDLVLTTVAAVASGLLGLVLAGMAILVGLLNEKYLRVASRAGAGVIEDFFPFSFAALVATITVLVSLASLVFVPRESAKIVRVVAGTNAFFLVWTLFSVTALVRFSAGVGVLREKMALDEPARGASPETDAGTPPTGRAE